MKRRGSNWFKRQARQDTYASASKMRTIARTGPERQAEPTRPKSQEGQKFFQAGVDEIGGDEII